MTQQPLPLYPIVARREKATGRLLLFMLQGSDVTCYDPSEGHSDSCREYYLTKTVSCPYGDTEAIALFTRYTKDWEGLSTPVLRKRLPYFS